MLLIKSVANLSSVTTVKLKDTLFYFHSQNTGKSIQVALRAS